MKKSTMKSLVAYLTNVNDLPQEILDAKCELEAELSKGEEKAAANRELYAAAKAVVMGKLGNKPMTVAELWEAVKDEMPEGMTKSKVQYALREYWANDVVKTEGKVNEYRKA